MAARTSHGFTLLELLVVTAIIGLLASIAIPQYWAVRARGYDSKVAAVVRHVATGQEAYHAVNGVYTSSILDLEALQLDLDVMITMGAGNSGSLVSSFSIQGSHPQAAHQYEWVSDPAPGDSNFIITP